MQTLDAQYKDLDLDSLRKLELYNRKKAAEHQSLAALLKREIKHRRKVNTKDSSKYQDPEMLFKGAER